MKAIETTGKLDENGFLIVSQPLDEKDRSVKVIVLISEEGDNDEESRWLYSAVRNPALRFLEDPEEDIYSATSGKPFHG